MAWDDVKKEMVYEKGLSEEAADQIGEYVSLQGETLLLFTKDRCQQDVGTPTSSCTTTALKSSC